MKWAIHHVTVPTHDTEKSAAFYRDVLGLDMGAPHTIGNGHVPGVEIVGDRNRGVHLVVPVPDMADKAGIGINPSFGGHVAIEVSDLDQVRRNLTAAGVYFVDMGERFVPGLPQIYVYDPSGNLLEINHDVDTAKRIAER